MEEWRSKWFLERRWQKCETEELIKAMSDINDHVRLAAVSACSKATELRQMKKEEHHLGTFCTMYFHVTGARGEGAALLLILFLTTL